MEKYINFICKYFEGLFYGHTRGRIYDALSAYFGIAGNAMTEQAISDLDNGFVSGTGINKCEIVAIENGEYRFKYIQEFTIKAEYLALIPIVANRIGYTEPKSDLPNEGE